MSQRYFSDAIRSVLGPTNLVDVQSSNSLTYAKNILTGPGEVYFVGILSSAAVAATIALIDATASGTADTVIWRVDALPTTPIICPFMRPLKFSKGIQITYSATAVSTVTTNVHWSPIANQGR